MRGEDCSAPVHSASIEAAQKMVSVRLFKRPAVAAEARAYTPTKLGARYAGAVRVCALATPSADAQAVAVASTREPSKQPGAGYAHTAVAPFV